MLVPILLAAGAAVAEGVAAIGGALLTAEGAAVATAGVTALGKSYVAKQAATVGLGAAGAAAAAAAPFVLGAITVWQVGKFFFGDDKK